MEKHRFLSQPWRMRVKKGPTQTVVLNEDLRLIGQGADMKSAYDDLARRTEVYWQEMKEFDLLDQLPKRDGPSLKEFFAEESRFFVRHLLLGVFYILIFAVMSTVLVKQIEKAMGRIQSEYARSTAPVNTPDGQKRFDRFKEDLENLKPYIREVKKVWEETK